MSKGQKTDVIVIADDLTGGADTGVQFCGAVGKMYLKHYKAETVACDNGLPGGVSIYTNSRHMRENRRSLASLWPWPVK